MPRIVVRSTWTTSLVLVAAAIAGLAVWRLADVLLLIFGSVLLAILLQAISDALQRWTKLGRLTCVSLAIVVTGSAIGALGWLFASEAGPQLTRLRELLPPALGNLRERLGGLPFGDSALDWLKAPEINDGLLFSLASNAATALAALLILFFAGLYLAYHPQTYFQGLIQLFPPTQREPARQVLERCGDALRRWMLGTLLSGFVVGLSTSLGLWIAGVPSPLALGFLAGVGQLVPVVGPVASALPGLVVAFAEGPQVLAWALVVYLASAQLEANVLTPLILRRMAQVPMAVTLFAVLAMGVLLGPLGVLFATPLAVVSYVLVKAVYVEGVLGERAAPLDVMAQAANRARPDLTSGDTL